MQALRAALPPHIVEDYDPRASSPISSEALFTLVARDRVSELALMRKQMSFDISLLFDFLCMMLKRHGSDRNG